MSDPWAGTALRKCQDKPPLNGGHRYAVKSSDGLYCWADAVKVDPASGYPEWYCERDGYCEHSKKLEWGILVDFRPDETLAEFKKRV